MRAAKRKGPVLFLLLVSVAALSASCSTSPTMNVYRGEPEMCAAGEVLVCNHGSRIKNADHDCTCKPERQTLNTVLH